MKKIGINPTPVCLSRKNLMIMLNFIKVMHKLTINPNYQELLDLPEVARFDPQHSGVMMGYDFHVTEQGPKLIEINTNAGGGYLAFQATHPQRNTPTPKLKHKILQMFSQEMFLFNKTKPSRIAIVDENPKQQFFYPEMQTFATIFMDDWGIDANILEPNELEIKGNKLYFGSYPIDMIYNRHCDFYLENLPQIKAAYLAQTVCLTPNPRIYALLADKQRMIIWSQFETLLKLGIDAATANFIISIVPESYLLNDLNAEDIWNDRKKWVFKPIHKFGSKGVIIGSSLRKKRFEDLPRNETLVQRFIKPSTTETEGETMKTDIRVFAYQDKILGIGARLYKGQVTNFQDSKSGYAPIKLV